MRLECISVTGGEANRCNVAMDLIVASFRSLHKQKRSLAFQLLKGVTTAAEIRPGDDNWFSGSFNDAREKIVYCT